MNHDLKLTVSKTIDAPKSAVWTALTDQEQIKKYFFGTEAESDWKEGSSIIFRGSWEGQEYEDKGTILEIEEEKLLKFDYWSSMSGTEDKPENYATITYRLDTKNGQTIVTVEQQEFRNQEAYDHSAESWKTVLSNLKSMIESH